VTNHDESVSIHSIHEKKVMKKTAPKISTLTATEIREALNMTQEQIALLCGIDRTLYAHWEKGRRKMPQRMRGFMIELMNWLGSQTEEEQTAMREQQSAYEEMWRTYYLGKLYQLTEELDRARARRDEAVRRYQLRAQMAVKVKSAATDGAQIPAILRPLCELAHPQLTESINRAHLEEILRLELAVSTLQFQIRQLRQWVVKGDSRPTRKAAIHRGSAKGTAAIHRGSTPTQRIGLNHTAPPPHTPHTPADW
jgi:transcriptional regulator with XRE-family HTH domain